jgi:glycine/D-amino acid oxidase-like deaminating enzyme
MDHERATGFPIRTTYAPTTTSGAPLDRDVEADVVVVGSGIVGVTTAVQLADRGADVVLLTADEVGDGVTGRSTAKVTALHQLVYADLIDRHGVEAARTYAAACGDAIAWLRDASGPVWEERAAVTVARDEDEERALLDEEAAARAAGLPVTLVDDAQDWPADAMGLELEAQGQVDPVALLQHLLAGRTGGESTVRSTGAGRIRVFPRTRATGLRERPGRATIRSAGGSARAPHAVIATGMPVFDRGGFFALAEPEASYVVALEHEGGPAEGDMMITAGKPSRSVRWAVDASSGRRVVLIGGEGHRVGAGGRTTDRYDRLEDWGRDHLTGVGPRVARWSAMDYASPDRLPFAGPHLRIGGPVHVVTGLSKWGMALGVACATALVDRIVDGRTTDFGRLVDPARLPGLRGAGTVASANVEVGARLASGWARSTVSAPPDQPGEGEGAVGRVGLWPRARCQVAGVVHDVSAVCPHLGGVVTWNDGDRTWDCPLHGSRFHAEGDVRHGPTTAGLS